MKPLRDVQLSEEEVMHLEALVRSPVYGTLRKLFQGYREDCVNQLLSEKNPARIFELQGRVIGIKVLENLPMIRAQQAEAKRKAAESENTEKEGRLTRARRRRTS